MNTKLTLRMEETLIEQVKLEAKNRGVSLSKLVSDYFELFVKEARSKASITSKLSGIMSNIILSEKEHKQHLEDKYL